MLLAGFRVPREVCRFKEKVWLSTCLHSVDYSGATAPGFHRLLLPERSCNLEGASPLRQCLWEVSLATSLLLVCAGTTASARTGGFPRPDEPLDEAGRRDARGLTLDARFRAHLARSPSRAAIETAAAIDVAAETVPALADVDHGRWAGRSFEDIAAAEPEALSRWIADPAEGAPDGESLHLAQRRIGEWLDAIATVDAPRSAITHAMTIRAALAHALSLPLPATLAIDIAPLSQLRLSFNGRWRLQALVPA